MFNENAHVFEMKTMDKLLERVYCFSQRFNMPMYDVNGLLPSRSNPWPDTAFVFTKRLPESQSSRSIGAVGIPKTHGQTGNMRGQMGSRTIDQFYFIFEKKY